MWLNSQFTKLLPTDTYIQKHTQLEERIRLLELWAATKSFYSTIIDPKAAP